MLWILGVVLLCYVLYVIYKPTVFWKKKGVRQDKAYPIFGTFLDVAFRKASLVEKVDIMYKEFPDEKYNGILQFVSPSLLIRDIDLIKKICVKDFDHFTDHRNIGATESDKFFSKNLIQLNGESWRDMRATISPAFTGSKMRSMFPLMSDCAEQMTDFFLHQNNKGVIEIEMKDLFTRYTCDVIATCAFGIKCDSLKEKKNTFYLMGKDITDLSGFRAVRIFIVNFLPGLVKLLNVSAFPKYLTDYFITIVKDTIKYRLENHVLRPDLIHLLLEARKGKLKHEDDAKHEDGGFSIVEESMVGKVEVATKEMTDEDIAAQAFLFFFAGFDTSSTMLSFMATEISLNPEIQEKLYEEVREVVAKCNGKLTYEAIMEMKYLDMVVSETLRKWPPGPLTDRVCTKEYKIDGDKPLTLKVGESISIPIYGIHMNEKYFPNPERFDPERFSDENKHKIEPYTYLPFGVGPRACIGSRFALLEIKILFAQLINKFEFVVIEKTQVPIRLTRKSLKMQPDNGFWLGIKTRT